MNAYAGLAVSMASKARRNGPEHDDLVQVALYGLLKALERFDPERGVAFSTFAHATISGELKRYRRNTTWQVHVPRALQERYLHVHRAVEELTRDHQREPTVDEIAVHTGEHPEAVIEVLDIADLRQPISLRMDEHEAAEREVATVETGYDLALNRASTASLLARLTDDERSLVQMRFFDGLSQSEIARRLEVSQMTVSRMLRAVLDRLRRYAEA